MGAFEYAAHLVLDHLREGMPLASWAVTRAEKGRHTYLYLDAGNGHDLRRGDSHHRGDDHCETVITEPDGTEFGTICGRHPQDGTGDPPMVAAAPLLKLVGHLLTVALAVDRAQSQAADTLPRERWNAQAGTSTGPPGRRVWQRVADQARS